MYIVITFILHLLAVLLRDVAWEGLHCWWCSVISE